MNPEPERGLEMKRALIVALVGAVLVLPGCIVIGGSSGSTYSGYGAVDRADLDRIVASNRENRIGDGIDEVLGRYPAEHLTLVQTATDAGGQEIAVYRVFARDRRRSTQFERYLVFKDNRLALLTDRRDDARLPAGVASQP